MITEFLDLTTLSERTGIGVRQLRYCVDSELVPFRDWFVEEHTVGQRRVFSFTTSVYIVCAALLLKAGCKKQAVHKTMELIGKVHKRRRVGLNIPMIGEALLAKSSAHAQVADGEYVRVRVDRKDSGWVNCNVRPPKPVPDYCPKIVIAIDLAQIRDLVSG